MTVYQVAEENVNNTVTYPKGLPKDRGVEGIIFECASVVLLLAVAVGVKTTQSSAWEIIPIVSLCVFIFLLTHLIYIRLCLFMEERHHIQGRYDGQFTSLLIATWSTNTTTKVALLICFFSVLAGWTYLGNLFILLHDLGPYSSAAVMVVAFIICHLVNVEKSILQNSINLEQMDGMDYGSGMAYNFFYGYLYLVLPNTGGQEKGLLERIEDFISREGLPDSSFPVKKMFMLIPSSAYTPSRLDDLSDGWMESVGSLDELVLNRAGVTERVYKNSVYRIKNPHSNDPPVYVVAEGATPLKSLHDAVCHNGENQEFYRKHLKEILSLFYKTLRRIIKAERGCRDLCELLYYIDLDEHGNRCVNVAELILSRIQKLQNMQSR